MRRLLMAAAIYCCAAEHIAHAQVIKIPVGQQSDTAATLPQRGATQATLETQRGQPLNKTAAVGNPPISRWDYAGYSVYFERDTVIHSIVNHPQSPGN
jgi:hypothetical protein